MKIKKRKKKDVVEQNCLFEEEEWWEEYWQDMPEYVHQNLKPERTLYLHFETEEDVQAFAELIGQRISPYTKYVWYPELKLDKTACKKWVEDKEKKIKKRKKK